MQVKMIAQLTGTRDGEDWPRVGATIDLPDAEAADLIMNGYAVDPADVEDETPTSRTTTSRPPTRPPWTSRPQRPAAAAARPDGHPSTSPPRLGG